MAEYVEKQKRGMDAYTSSSEITQKRVAFVVSSNICNCDTFHVLSLADSSEHRLSLKSQG